MMTTAQRAKLKQSPELYKLTMRIDENSRAVAKVVSAAEYLSNDDRDPWPLFVSLDALLHERRGMRRRMWGMLAVLIMLACGQAHTQVTRTDAKGLPPSVAAGEDTLSRPAAASGHAEARVTPAEAKGGINPINRRFYIAEAVRWGAAVADFETTRRYVPAGRCVESAPLLGREPSTARVYGVGVAFDAGVTLASYLLQRHLRRHSPDDRTAALLFLEGGVAAAHAYSAAHNGGCL